MSYFGLKSQIFLKNGESGIKYFKLKGRQKKSGGPHAARGLHFGHVCHRYSDFQTVTDNDPTPT
jgi:hypothetical protein